MPYLIDGSNLIGHIPNLDFFDSRSKNRLVAQLSIFQAFRKTKVILVFDGPPDPEITGTNSSRKEFSILWPDPEEDADIVIKRLIDKQTDVRHLYVVSSDREIQSFARENRAKVLDCETFHEKLTATLKRYKASRAAKKQDLTLSPLETNHWLAIFGDSDE